ncbi:MAG TPA: DUF1761 domain-containing protein [Chitinophagaceae bacterium]|nr:DUF1761 domain-containing protein [Chitinophagaceae bacterium]
MSFDIFSNLNWLAIVVGGLAYFALGAIWYSFIFKNAWIRLSGVNPNDPNMKSGVAGVMLTSLVLMIVASLGVALFMGKMEGPANWMTGAKTGLVAGVCFSFTAISIAYLYEKKPFGLHLINGVYNTLGSMLAGIIIAVWP